ncbi:MAG: CPBP family intramembrane metalloprotease, partial [Alphaproteobacteria bacterium]|nr:CPBP family intramembrane metalloprotease [Alphaproteobacteria bacterium]
YFASIAGKNWNWGGKGLSFCLSLAIAAMLIAARKFAAPDFGLALRQAPGTGRAFLFGVVPFLVLLAAATAKWFGHDALPDRETIWFQATMPGLAEELSFRGVLLALFDRLFAMRFNLGGAEIGYGVFATSVIFGIGHGIALDHALALHWDIVNGLSAAAIGLFLAWLRLRTKSLVLPIVAHNAINLIFFCVPRLG